MTTARPVDTLQLPLARDESGVIRVGGTRVTLDLIVKYHRQGHSAESIASKFPTLRLSDVYAAMAFYLANSDAVDREIEFGKQQADEWRAKLAPFAPTPERIERLLAKRPPNSPT
jgi:uncharacterized protein (DUF433 family)